MARNTWLTLRLSGNELDDLKGAASKMGLSVSSYVRLVLSNARGNAPNPINENDLSELRLSMKRIGNNLNQIARHANSRNFDDECAVALKARLSELSAATENVSNLIFEARRAR